MRLLIPTVALTLVANLVVACGEAVIQRISPALTMARRSIAGNYRGTGPDTAYRPPLCQTRRRSTSALNRRVNAAMIAAQLSRSVRLTISLGECM